MSYEPTPEILEKYAKVLVNFALNSGKGIKQGDVIRLSSPLSALPFYRALKKQIINSGGLIINGLYDDMDEGSAKYFYEHAKEAGLSLEEYWDQIIKACYLDEKDPVEANRKAMYEVERVAKTLTDLDIQKIHAVGADMDLRVTLGEGRKWLGGTGRNIPSFEVFTSPDWRGTEGWIRFNQPLYRYGSMVKGIELTFENGRVVSASAKENEKLLKEMLATDDGASQMGEYSLTDKRLSKITKFMAETLFDENMGGKFGNTHIAVGRSYHDTYAPGPEKMTSSLAKKLGYNTSTIHTDMISTVDRTVTATLKDGSTRVIYKSGQFTI
jgi:aminopeptidase